MPLQALVWSDYDQYASLKLQVSLQNIGLLCRALLRKRPVILRSLLSVATPYKSNFRVITETAAVCCSVWQCVAVSCSALQCVAVCRSVSQCVAVCSSVLQCVAVCCSVLQCVADTLVKKRSGLQALLQMRACWLLFGAPKDPMRSFFWKECNRMCSTLCTTCYYKGDLMQNVFQPHSTCNRIYTRKYQQNIFYYTLEHILHVIELTLVDHILFAPSFTQCVANRRPSFDCGRVLPKARCSPCRRATLCNTRCNTLQHADTATHCNTLQHAHTPLQ